ncbi:hypothetical protein AMK27_02405 [Streptomyces sp. CB02009]|uniref:hypothetical protein n=1 Tax=Streptomyces sp. CB02009 TaxID=1703938 RepID=UPI00093B9564|nr:hypothetical protein [Streptomyces sp. CB02009]OKJ64759.1 hypothetical protein AMK27_02405 [Streptomyces sp. CB02009]
MARTAHHIPRSRRRLADEDPWRDPYLSLVLYDLRRDAACLTEAAREGARPRPRAIRRTVALYDWPRFQQDRTVAHWAAMEERRARTRLRIRTGLLLRLVNLPGGTLDPGAADTVDVPPARHRRCGLWFA